MQPLRAITIKQPWAHAIIHGGKDIENRSWATSYRGTLAIHAGRASDDDAFFDFVAQRGLASTVKLVRADSEGLVRGAVIGIVDLVDCVERSTSPWFEGPFGFVLANPRLLEPVSCRGAMGLFDLPPEVVEAVERQISR
ncbi:MAG: ASCH domain-containing protein [Hyphomonadaceae bacterium]|nr:ASCH domain-containing protein [Hyphomonadaceae bacterium]